MPNVIKYSEGAQDVLALKKNNFYIGVGDVGKGPTSSTGYYNCVDVPDSGYNVYLNKASGGPSIYSFESQSDYLAVARVLSGIDFTGFTQSFNWFATQTDKIVVDRDYESITTNGLVLHIDAGYLPSYHGSGTTVYNLGNSQLHGTLTNGTNHDFWGQGRFIFDGTDDIIKWNTQPVTGVTTAITYCAWINMNSLSGDQALFSFRDSMITINSGTSVKYWWNVGAVNGQFSTSAIKQGFWHHFVVVQSGTSASLYIDGNLISSITSGTIGTLRDAKAIGQYDTSPSAYGKFNGSIAVASIYNIALTSSQISQNYNAQKDRFIFESTWKTDNAGTSSSNQIALPLESSAYYDMTVDWGDGTTSTITSATNAARTHTYPSAGTYTVKISGRFGGFRFIDGLNNGGDKLKILTIKNYGCMEIFSNATFWGCANLTSNCKYAPKINTTNISLTFHTCRKFNGPVNNFKTDGCNPMNYMFTNCDVFNQPVCDWKTSSCTGLEQMFSFANKFNQDVSTWDVSNVAGFNLCFRADSNNGNAFNNGGRNLLGRWNVSNGTNFSGMFDRCRVMNQDLSSWYTPKATNMDSMFSQCRSLDTEFTNLVTSGVTNIGPMFWQNYKLKSTRLSHFVTSANTSLYFTFAECPLVTGEGLENWDTSKVTNFGYTFAYSGVREGISNWDTRKATSMVVMFAGCSELIDDLSSWVTSGCTGLQYMFVGASKFNSPIGSWDVRLNGSYNQFLLNATAFNQPLGDWEPIGSTDFINFMNGKTSANYNAQYLTDIYNNWSQLNVKSNATANFGTIKYTSSGAAGRATLVSSKGWTITDGGQV